MIVYDNKVSLLYLVTTLKGTITRRAFPSALLSAVISLILAVLRASREGRFSTDEAERTQLNERTDLIFGISGLSDFRHPFAVQTFVVILGWTLVFRVNNALGRYMEAVTHLKTMSSKFVDSHLQLLCFIHSSFTVVTDRSHRETLLRLRYKITHWFSLLGMLCVNDLKDFGLVDDFFWVLTEEEDAWKWKIQSWGDDGGGGVDALPTRPSRASPSSAAAANAGGSHDSTRGSVATNGTTDRTFRGAAITPSERGPPTQTNANGGAVVDDGESASEVPSETPPDERCPY